jgi:hypothetical protein
MMIYPELKYDFVIFLSREKWVNINNFAFFSTNRRFYTDSHKQFPNRGRQTPPSAPAFLQIPENLYENCYNCPRMVGPPIKDSEPAADPTLRESLLFHCHVHNWKWLTAPAGKIFLEAGVESRPMQTASSKKTVHHSEAQSDTI